MLVGLSCGDLHNVVEKVDMKDASKSRDPSERPLVPTLKDMFAEVGAADTSGGSTAASKSRSGNRVCLLPLEAGGHPGNRTWLHRDASIDGASAERSPGRWAARASGSSSRASSNASASWLPLRVAADQAHLQDRR